MSNTHLKVQIGNFTIDGVLIVTDAPRAYDGFGTVEVQNFESPVEVGGVYTKGDARLVLVRSEHLDWQTSRYSSGLHAAHPAEDYFVAGAEEALVKRLTGAE